MVSCQLLASELLASELLASELLASELKTLRESANEDSGLSKLA
jgi:hypothetical protein